MKWLRCLSVVIFLLSAYTVSGQNTDVVVLPMQTSVPAGAKKLGSLKAGNNATTMHCDYEALIATVKEKARAMHGNLVKITELDAPAFIGKCYKIWADVYFTDDISPYAAQITKAMVQTDAEACATIYFYRLRDTLALVTSYNVHLNGDSVVYNARKRSVDSIKVKNETDILLWAKTEKRTELRLHVKPGNSYYVRCGLVKGEIRMVPVLEEVPSGLGREESGGMIHNKKDKSASYLREVH